MRENNHWGTSLKINSAFPFWKLDKGHKIITEKNLDCNSSSETGTNIISNNIDYENSEYYISFIDSENVTDKFDLPKIYQLKYNDIRVDEEKGIFYIKIGLWHSDFGEKYDALNIITPNIIQYPGML